MSALTRQNNTPFRAMDWQPDVTQLLDEHHMVAWSDRSEHRLHFAVSLSQFLESQRDTEVCSFYGRFITNLEDFCHQLERAIPGPALRRQIDGPDGVTDLVRSRQVLPGKRASRFRYYIWHDADVLLEHDKALFGRLVDTLAGVAAEAEYASDDLLLIHRAVFVGGVSLQAYANESAGQFRSWADDGFAESFWEVLTGLEVPPFMRYQVDILDH